MVLLQQSVDKWNFQTEAELEEFIWTNLEGIFDLLPLKRQHHINGQYCDIVAVSRNRQLVVIELKNQEDRYVVQQLTRYYHALIENKPHDDKVDYSKPVRLIAVSPSFHRDNLIDRQYNTLSIEFLTFKIVHEDLRFNFILQNTENGQFSHFDIVYKQEEVKRILPSVPRKLLNWTLSNDENIQKRILDIREKILNFDERLKEINSTSSVLYSKTKNSPCAEFRFDKLSNSFRLFLWLPHPSRKHMARMLISTQDWLSVTRLDYCPKGFRKGDAWDWSYWSDPIDLVKWYQKDRTGYAAKGYKKLLDNPSKANSLDLIIEVALDIWLTKIS
jgi:RecB family endonuclease NucS